MIVGCGGNVNNYHNIEECTTVTLKGACCYRTYNTSKNFQELSIECKVSYLYEQLFCYFKTLACLFLPFYFLIDLRKNLTNESIKIIWVLLFNTGFFLYCENNFYVKCIRQFKMYSIIFYLW